MHLLMVEIGVSIAISLLLPFIKHLKVFFDIFDSFKLKAVKGKIVKKKQKQKTMKWTEKLTGYMRWKHVWVT